MYVKYKKQLNKQKDSILCIFQQITGYFFLSAQAGPILTDCLFFLYNPHF